MERAINRHNKNTSVKRIETDGLPASEKELAESQ